MTEDSQRKSAQQIFDNVRESARDEVRRRPVGLAISGLAGGMTMGLTALGSAIGMMLPNDGQPHPIWSALLYPLGFVAVIIGRSQLFTENTLYPVILVLDERRYLLRTLRLWGIVFATNVVGALVFAHLVMQTTALEPQYRNTLIELGLKASQHPPATLFWSAVIGGWMIALVAWLVSASQWSIAQIVITYLLAFLVGAGHFMHCIAGSCEVLSAVAGHALSYGQYFRWLALVASGNICGGIFIVSLLNWGQVTAEN